MTIAERSAGTGLESLHRELARLGLVPETVDVVGAGCREPLVTVIFATAAEVRTWCAAAGVEVEVIDRSVPLGFIEYGATHARPGMRLCVSAYVWPESAEEPVEQVWTSNWRVQRLLACAARYGHSITASAAVADCWVVTGPGACSEDPSLTIYAEANHRAEVFHDSGSATWDQITQRDAFVLMVNQCLGTARGWKERS